MQGQPRPLRILNAPYRRCGVIGSPIAHSLSPALHRAAYVALGLDWSYAAVEVDERGLPDFLASLTPQWRGLSVTAPLKRAVVGLVDRASALVQTVGAANTVLIDGEGRRCADNTDVSGIVAALSEKGVSEVASPLLLGGGATAASALAGLAQLGSREAAICVRMPDRAAALESLGKRLGVAVSVHQLTDRQLPAADVVVSTIPADASAPLAERVADRSRVVLDVGYHPWPTPLAEAAARHGRVVVTGLDLLVHQAARQVELMTGHSPAPLAQMRAAVHSRGPGRPKEAGAD